MPSILELLIIMSIMKFTPCKSYTMFNLVALIYSIVRRKMALYPILLVNSLALQMTFYCTRLFIDSSLFIRIMQRERISAWAFFMGDMLVHTVPSVLWLAILVRYPVTWKEIGAGHPNSIHFAGLFSLFLNLTWALMNYPSQFDVSNIYVPLDGSRWKLAWHFSAIHHVGFSALLSMFLRKNNIT